MRTEEIVRGATTRFAAQFFDANGQLTAPTSATIKIKQGLRVENGTLTQSGNDWVYDFQTAGWRRGFVHWFIGATGGSVKFSDQGILDLKTNAANA